MSTVSSLQAGSDASRPRVLGYPLDLLDLEAAAQRLLDLARTGGAARAVTLNPEIVVQALRDAELAGALRDAELVVPDGIGIVWAARREGLAVPGRVPGVELVEAALCAGGGELSVFFLGGRPGVAERASAEAHRRWGTRVAGCRDGYFRRPEEVPDVLAQVRDARADLLLAGLGAGQEAFLARHAEELGAGVAVGVGGTLDVLAGEAERTPEWTRRLGLEWAWRVGLDPQRWPRAPRLARFLILVLTGR